MLKIDKNHDFYGFISIKDPSITHIVNQFYNSINLHSIDSELNIAGKLLTVNTMVKNKYFLIKIINLCKQIELDLCWQSQFKIKII